MEFLEYITYIEYIIFFEDYFKTTNEDIIYEHYHTLQFYFYSQEINPHNTDFNDFFDCIYFWGNKGYYYNDLYRLDIFYSDVFIDRLIGEKVANMEIESINNFVGTLFYCDPFKKNSQFCIYLLLTFMLGKF